MGHPGELSPPGHTPVVPRLDFSGSLPSFGASRTTQPLSVSGPKLRTTVTKSQNRIPGYTGHMPGTEHGRSGCSFGYLERHATECKTFRETTGYDFLARLSSREVSSLNKFP